MPYQPTWINPYMPMGAPSQGLGQGTVPVQQPQGATGWNRPVDWQQYQQPVNGIVKVNGPDSAMQVNLPPNSTSQPLMDSKFDGNGGMFYVVSTDGTGSKSIEVFDYSRHVEAPPQAVPTDAVSRDEFNMALGAIETLKGEISELRAAIPPAV